MKDFNKTPEYHIAIPFGKKFGGVFYDKFKNPIEFEPKGLSGCGIWYFTPEDKSIEKPRYALLRIVTSYFRQNQVLVATHLEPLINEIANKYNIALEQNI